MASTLRFRTPHIEELPTTQSRQAPGFAWVAVSGPAEDPNQGAGKNKKRSRASLQGPTEAQREAISSRHQREVERRIKELNSDNSKDVQIPIPKAGGVGGAGGRGGGGSNARVGKTANTKKILASGKTFAHHLDDEEAEIARTGKRDGDLDVAELPPPSHSRAVVDAMDDVADMEVSQADIEALLAVPPLTYNQARSAPPPLDAPPPRRFCSVCGFFERAKCRKCGVSYCSVVCKDTHDVDQCLKFYA